MKLHSTNHHQKYYKKIQTSDVGNITIQVYIVYICVTQDLYTENIHIP